MPANAEIYVAIRCAGRCVFVLAEVRFTDGLDACQIDLTPEAAAELEALSEALRVRRAKVIGS